MSEDTIRDVIRSARAVGPEDFEPGTVADFERQLARLPKNDTGNALRFIKRRGRDFLWVKDSGWFAWDGTRWDFANGEIRMRLAAQRVAECIRHEAAVLETDGLLDGETQKQFEERIERAHKWCVGSGNAGRLAAMITEAAPHLARRQEELDADPFLFNVANGTLELGEADADGQVEVTLRDHSRDDWITRISPVQFDPDATACPHWHSFLDFFLPDPDVQQFLQRYFGYSLTGSMVEQCLALFHGEGRNGKSTLVDLMAWLMGDYAMSLPINSLLANDRKGGSEATPDLARLPGSRMVRSSEPKQGAAFDESLLKQLTGGEPITVRHLNRGFFDFAPSFKLVLSFNRRPIVRGDDDGIWRRLLMVPFEKQVPIEKVDKHFLEKLKGEGPAILNWVLDGYRLWRERGLEIPEKVRIATDEYRADSNPLGNFVESSCIITGDMLDMTTASELFTAYTQWCKRNAQDPVTSARFGRRMGERKGVTKIRSGTIRYAGIKLIDKSLLDDQAGAGGPQ